MIGPNPLAQVQELNNTAVTNVIATAMQQLQQVQLREKLLRPLRYEPRDKLHQPDPEPKRKFNALVQDELSIKRLNRSDWLQVAVWWLLKTTAAEVILVSTSAHVLVQQPRFPIASAEPGYKAR
ncbi:hypothetical protein ETB97_007346 [Aspergillus alliaceus]|uniref:Uncharacterized protein n=1 Tax=Petromyces alliaceus TaxID=209559 RepID=A0A8H6ADW9_PETAA|nr:hypothetical protein ETB97_007346 [Aspergillus burnettii]